jgi:ssDNA-binding replication factor A large subunit
MLNNYEQLLSRISHQSGLSNEEIERKIEAKRAKLSGLISKEGAAQVIAAELGINFDNQQVKISELFKGMRKASVSGKVLQIFPVRTYTRSGTENKVANLVIADETATIRTVLWDTHHISLVEEEKIKPGIVVDIKNASVRGTQVPELHLTNLSSIEIIDKDMPQALCKESLHELRIKELTDNLRAKIRGTIVQLFEPRFFYVCPECKTKATPENDSYTCKTHGSVMPEKRALLTLIVDDGTEVIRATLFNEVLFKLLNISSIDELENSEFFTANKNEIIGKELFLEGRVKKNQMFNSLDFIVSDIKEATPEDILDKLKT